MNHAPSSIPPPSFLSPSFCVLHLDCGREWRGGQAQVLNLCKGLQTRDIRQILAAPPESPLLTRAMQAGIPVAAVNMHGEFDLFAARKLKKLIWTQGVSLVHTHDAHAHALACLAAPRHLPIAVSRRVDFAISKNWFSRRKYFDKRVSYLSISNGVADVLKRGGIPAEKIYLVPSGVDATRFTYQVPREKMREEFGIPNDAPVIGTIGSLVDHKGHQYLIDAAPRVLERYPNARFILVGDGNLEQTLKTQVTNRQLQASFVFTGRRNDVETFLSSFDVFALSSHLEGLCTSVIDAQLFALPVAATRTGGVPDLVIHEQTGLLAEPKNPAALADAILRLLDTPTLAKRLGKAGRDHALAGFTAEKTVEKTIAAYAAIMKIPA
jgi:L-malate glycosyltransferase